jgi:hypothetical protein
MLKIKIILTFKLIFILNICSANLSINSVNFPFVKNVGQSEKDVKYYTQTPNALVYIDEQGRINYKFNKKDEKTSVVIRETFVEGTAKIVAQNKGTAQINVIKGNNPKNWHNNIPSYSILSQGEMWKDIHVEIISRPGNIEKLFTLQPGANVGDIQMLLEGQSDFSLKEDGQLHISTKMGSKGFTKPIAWQELSHDRNYVNVEYVINNNQYGFKLGKYNHQLPLIIDPLIASTYIGGNFDDHAGTVLVNANDEVIIAGATGSTSFPTTIGAMQETLSGSHDFFALKFNADMSELLASTLYGGNGTDFSHGAVFDANENIYFGGYSTSTDFPIPALPYVPYQETIDANGSIFIAALSADFSQPMGATHIGGNVVDQLRAIDIGPNGNIYITGFTNSIDYPYTAGVFVDSGQGIVLSAFNPDLSQLLLSTRIGS